MGDSSVSKFRGKIMPCGNRFGAPQIQDKLILRKTMYLPAVSTVEPDRQTVSVAFIEWVEKLMPKKWSDLETKKLRQLFEEKKSYSQIANILGRSRNSVAGKCTLIGLYCGDPNSTEQKQRKAENGRLSQLATKIKLRKNVAKPAKFSPILLDDFCYDKLDGNILPEPGQCKYPSGGWKSPIRFCCNHKHIEGSSYCTEHTLIATAPKHFKLNQRKDNIRCL